MPLTEQNIYKPTIASLFQALGRVGMSEKTAGQRHDERGLRRGTEGREPVRRSTNHAPPPTFGLMRCLLKSKDVNWSIDSYGS